MRMPLPPRRRVVGKRVTKGACAVTTANSVLHVRRGRRAGRGEASRAEAAVAAVHKKVTRDTEAAPMARTKVGKLARS